MLQVTVSWQQAGSEDRAVASSEDPDGLEATLQQAARQPGRLTGWRTVHGDMPGRRGLQRTAARSDAALGQMASIPGPAWAPLGFRAKGVGSCAGCRRRAHHHRGCDEAPEAGRHVRELGAQRPVKVGLRVQAGQVGPLRAQVAGH